MIGHMLNRSVDVYREMSEPDGSGGQVTVWVRVASGAPARIAQPSTEERVAAQQAGADLAHRVYFAANSDVRRKDELRDPETGETWRVTATVYPSVRTTYLRADCERVQHSQGD